MARLTGMLGGPRGLVAAGVLLLAALGVFLLLILAEDDPPAIAEEELPAGCAKGLPHLTCTYTSSTTLDFDQMVTAIRKATGLAVGDGTPVWVQAWGGEGGKGSSSAHGPDADPGAQGGDAGYATTVSSVGSLSGDSLYLYVGASGRQQANRSGKGGASSIVTTQQVSRAQRFPGPALVVAGGGGGGGGWKGSCTKVAHGGAGGLAIATGSAGAFAPGENGHGAGPGIGGGDSGGNGSGGAGGDEDAVDGSAGLGGFGGAGRSGDGSLGWLNVNAVDPGAANWNAGAGGEGRGGGGGGGYGGGGGGGGCVYVKSVGGDVNGGGGGGGSAAAGNVLRDSDAPTNSQRSDDDQSKIVLTFHVSGSG